MDIFRSLGRSEEVCRTLTDYKPSRLLSYTQGSENRNCIRHPRQVLTRLTQNVSRHSLRPSPIGRIPLRANTERSLLPVSVRTTKTQDRRPQEIS